MNKTAIKNFAIQARNKLIADVCYRAGLVGITEKGIQAALPQSDSTTEFYDIGIATPYAVSGQAAIRQRRNLAEAIRRREADSDYTTAYRCIMEEVAYTWFNRLIAVRFMEANDYLPGRVRVLSSESGKIEPDLVTNPFDTELSFTAEEEQAVLRLKQDNKLDELFRLLFIKQCNALAAVLPALFEQTEDYTELLLNLSVVDQEGVVWHLTHDIPEDDFNVEKGGQVEIIGWLYQYYNTEPKSQVFARPSGQKIKKEEIPAATQLFTPDWIVRYMVENSLGRVVINNLNYDIWADEEKEKIGRLKAKWKYYLDEAPQTPEVDTELRIMEHNKYASDEVQPFIDTKLIDPCMGSGHILVYAFDVFMDIYKEQGWNPRDAAQRIVQKNIYGLDIDKRAWQLAYFAVMMKARQYDRRFFTRGIQPKVYYPGGDKELEEFGSLNLVDEPGEMPEGPQTMFDLVDYENRLNAWSYRYLLAQKYDVVVTNPPYMGGAGMGGKLAGFVKENYPDSKSDLSTAFMDQTIRLCNEHGYMSMINIPVWMFLSSYEKLREKMIKCNTFINMVHPGRGIFGSDFGTTTFVIQKAHIPGYIGSYRRLFEKQGEVESIEEREQAFLAGKGSFTAQQDNFSKIPGSPVAYWVSRDFIAIFSHKDSIGDFCYPRQGLHTGNNEKYLRFWYEVCGSEIMFAESEMWDSKAVWAKLNKGGNYRKWYGNREYIIFWKDNGLAIKTNGHSVGASNKTFLQNMIGFTDITSYKASFRFYGKGFVYDVSGPAMFNTENVVSNNFLLGLLNSKICDEVMLILSPTIHMNQTALSKVSVIHTNISKVEELVQQCITISKTDWDSFETSWDFKEHPFYTSARWAARNGEWITVQQAFEDWQGVAEGRFQQLKTNEEELNRIFIDIYGLQDELTPEVEDKDVTVRRADLGRDIRSLLSYAVGCMFGRYSLDEPGLILAGYSKREHVTKTYAIDSPELEVFARKNPDGSVSYVSHDHWVNQERFKSFPIINDNILPLTDEAYLEDDIVSRLCQWLRVVYGENTLEENLDFIAKALGNKGSTSREVIRNYFLKDFFADHCKIYQKRPIYWLFDSGKQNGFKALVYLHRYTPDTIGKLRVDYLHRLQRVYASEIERMQDMIDNSQNPREVTASTKRKEKLQKQLKECREYDEKIAHLALARIELDLDDGVKVNYRKLQTASDGKLYEVLADSKNIMGKS